MSLTIKKIVGIGFLLYVSAAVVTAFAGGDVTDYGDQSHHAPAYHRSTQHDGHCYS